MVDVSEEFIQLIGEVKKSDPSFSAALERLYADFGAIPGFLHPELAKIPELLVPDVLVKLRELVEVAQSNIQEGLVSIGREYLARHTALRAELPSPQYTSEVPAPAEIALPPSIREGTRLAAVYTEIARGNATRAGLKERLPKYYFISNMLNVLKKKGVIERVRYGEYRIRQFPEHLAADVQQPQAAGQLQLPPSLSPKETEVYRAIKAGAYFHSNATSDIVYRLKAKGVIEGDGRRGDLRIKGQTHLVVPQIPSAPRADSANVSAHIRPTAPMTTAQAIDIATMYAKEHPNQEISYDVMRTVIPGVARKQFDNVMTRVKSRQGFSGGRGTVKYAGTQPVTAQPLPRADGPEYRDGGALPAEVTVQPDGAPKTVHGPSTSVKYNGGTTPLDTIQPSLSVEAVIEYLGRLSERLPETQADRLEDYALRVVPPDNPTPEQMAALNNIGRTLERYLDEGGDIDRFLAGLEKTGTSVPDVTKYLDSLRTTVPPLSVNDQHSYPAGPQKAGEEYSGGLDSYYGIAPEMDRSLSKLQETAERLPEGLSERIERLLLDKVLPNDTETVGDEYAHALDALRTALEDSLRREDAEPLIQYLEAQEEIDPEELETYLNEFDGQSPVVTIGLVPSVRSAGPIGPADLRTDPVWGPLFSKKDGPHSAIVGSELPYIAERDSRLPAALKSLIPKSGSPDWTVYAIGQIGGFLRTVEEIYGNTPAGVTKGIITLLNHPDNQHYLGKFLHAVGGKSPYVTAQQGVACLQELHASGNNRAIAVLRKYNIRVK